MATIETRKSAKGTTYRVRVRLDGKPPATRSFPRLAAAKAWARHTEAAIRNGSPAAGSVRTLAETIDAFLATGMAGRKDPRMLTTRAAWWRAELGRVKLRDLTAQHIADALDKLERTPQAPKKDGEKARMRTAATINRYRAAISAVLTWAEKRPTPWIGSNPARKTEQDPKPLGVCGFSRPMNAPRCSARASKVQAPTFT